jgi:hypothetical protein
MEDRAFGWTVEMQLKAASRGFRCVEVPVRYRRRIGRSNHRHRERDAIGIRDDSVHPREVVIQGSRSPIPGCHE